MKKLSVADWVESGLVIYGKETNCNRNFARWEDGLKTSYRRALYTALQQSGMVKTATLSAQTLHYHPHGTDSCDGVIENLGRLGILDHIGSFGKKMLVGDDTAAANGRYTTCGISKRWRDAFEPLLPYVPKQETELGGDYEVTYLPSPIPLAFLCSANISMSVGQNARIPYLDLSSLVKAHFADDPMKLKGAFGVEIDYDKSEMMSLWTKGLARITFKYKVTTEWIDGEEYHVISAPNAEIFKPDLRKLNKYIESGKLFTIDLSDGTRVAIGVGRNKRVDHSNMDEALEILKTAAEYSKTYRLTVTDGDHSYIIPLREWLIACKDNYISLVNTMRSDKISKATFNRQVYEFLPQVGKIIVSTPDITDKGILSKVNGLTDNILKAILTKSISQLRKGDTSKEIEKYQKEIDYWTKLDAVEYTKSVMEKL